MKFRAGILSVFLAVAPAADGELLFAPEGNRLHVIDLASVDRPPLRSRVLIESAADDARRGRDINGTVCALPGPDGLFVAGEDTGQPGRPAGWGVFGADGHQVGKLAAPAEAEQPEPYGCAVDSAGRLFTSEVGDPGFLSSNGQLLLWFPPYERFPNDPERGYSDHFCVLADDIGTAGGIVIDGDGRVYVASSSGRVIWRFSPPFPTAPDAAGGCGAGDPREAPRADRVVRERFVGAEWRAGLITYSGLALSRDGRLFAASVATGRIGEFDLDGRLRRLVLAPDAWLPPFETGTPHGLALDAAGSLYYADLDLVWHGWRLGPGPDGGIWRIRFDSVGEPLSPERLVRGLAFPDGLGVLPGSLSPGPDE